METDISGENNFARSLDFLRKLNALSLEGQPVSHLKIFGKYNVWIFFQTRLFFNDLKDLHKKLDDLNAPKLSLRVMCQNLLLSILGLVLSCIALVSSILFKKKVLVYSIDRANSALFYNDARMDPIYKYLKESHVPFTEFLHTIFDRTFVQKFFKRKRFAMYMKSIDIIFPLACLLGLAKTQRVDVREVDLSAFKIEEREYAKSLLHKYLSSIDLVVFRVQVIRKILSWTSLEVLLTIDNTRDYWELVLACKMNGIPVYAFQHGHFTKYHVGWLNDGSFGGEIAHPDRLFVWSDFWKKELLRLGTYFPKESIEVGGLKGLIEIPPEKTNRSYIGVLIPYEVDSSKTEVKRYIDEMLSCSDIKLFFKLRTDTDIDRQLKEYSFSKEYSPNLEFISEVSSFMPEIDVVVGTYSTFLYDMIAYERPVALLDTSSDFGEGLVINGLADTLNLTGVCAQVKELSGIKRGILKERKTKLFGNGELLMHDTVRDLCLKR